MVPGQSSPELSLTRPLLSWFANCKANPYGDKSKPADSRVRKATDPRFLRDAYPRRHEKPKTAGLPKGGVKSWPKNWEAEMKGQVGNEARAAIDSLIARAGHTRTEYSSTANPARPLLRDPLHHYLVMQPFNGELECLDEIGARKTVNAAAVESVLATPAVQRPDVIG
jgi:hypothetical protein